jgi:tRNA-2-methylthio-N6-dimethylallyladenosine synthase
MLAQLLERIEVLGQRVCETRFDRSGEYLKTSLPEKPLARVKSYVTIMQGCDHFCSFCIVPYVRGRERSRPGREILEEIRHLAERGVKEVFPGQNVNGYGRDWRGRWTSSLLSGVNEIEGIERIRFTTSHPADFQMP